MRFTRFAFALALVVAGAAHAGKVDVSLAGSAWRDDAGASRQDKRAAVQTLARHLERLGQRYLPAQQSLKIELLDVDLAGTVRMPRRSGQDVRVLHGRADFPRIALRYTLESDGRVLRSSEETVSDLDYLRRLEDRHSSESLPHEKRMLEAWFRARFATAPDAQQGPAGDATRAGG